MFKIRYILIATVLILAPCIVVFILLGPELSTEQSLTQRLAECHMRLQYLESMYRARQEDVSLLSQYLGQLQYNNGSNVTIVSPPPQPVANLLDALSPEARQLLRNASHFSKAGISESGRGRLPIAYPFLPHLLHDTGLRPAYLRSKGRTDVSIVLGVNTVKRKKQSYVRGTLYNLIENMNEEEQNETLIIVYIGETDLEAVELIARQIEMSFEEHLESGFIDIISPASSYYPEFERLGISVNDPLESLKGYSKQNLDFAYLMAYAQAKGTFYVQLEDDIRADRGFLTTMKRFALISSSLVKMRFQPDWFVLDFCQYDFVGKMFKSIELPYFISYLQMFYYDKPAEELLSHFIETKACYQDHHKLCKMDKSKYWLYFGKSLFQHIGSFSHKAKLQMLKGNQYASKLSTNSTYKHAPLEIRMQELSNNVSYSDSNLTSLIHRE